MAHRPELSADRHAALEKALDGAIKGQPRPLYDLLARHSHLPGPRPNDGLLDEFADMAAGRGKSVVSFLETLATLDADVAQGGTEYEFVPMAGVMSIGVLAAKDTTLYPRLLAALHHAADDLRFKVRDTVPRALARIGATRGDELVTDVEGWMDGFFHAASVLRGLAVPAWLTSCHDGATIVARLDAAFETAANATRSSSRYPGYKALVEVLAITPGLVAQRFGVPVFDVMVEWSKTKEPVLREAIEKNLLSARLAGRHAADIERVRKALEGSAKVRRDPTTYVGPTRSRGKVRGKATK